MKLYKLRVYGTITTILCDTLNRIAENDCWHVIAEDHTLWLIPGEYILSAIQACLENGNTIRVEEGTDS